jgi:hypothetical protein
MNTNLHKKLLLHISNNDFGKASQVLHKLAENKISDRIRKCLSEDSELTESPAMVAEPEHLETQDKAIFDKIVSYFHKGQEYNKPEQADQFEPAYVLHFQSLPPVVIVKLQDNRLGMFQGDKLFVHNVDEDQFDDVIMRDFHPLIEDSINEGMFDRLDARFQGMKANLKTKAKNFGTKVSAAPKAAMQGVKAAFNGGDFSKPAETIKTAQKQIAANNPAKAAKAAQINSIVSSIRKDLSKLYPTAKVDKALDNLKTNLQFTKI